MAERTTFSATGATGEIRARRAAYFATISGVGSVQLMLRPRLDPWLSGNHWIPAAAPQTATMTQVSSGDLNVQGLTEGADWRVDVTVTSGDVVVDFFPLEIGG